MTTAPTNAASAEVTPIDRQARGPLLLLLVLGVLWLVPSGIFALLASIQLHSPQFLTDCEWLTHGRLEALQETAFLYGWAANVGLAIALWVLARLGGYPLRALNWTVAGAIFWNLGLVGGLVGIATGDMTTFSFFQLPRYVQPLMVFAYAAMAISGVLAWSGRRTDSTFAAHWYAVAALFLFPWMFLAAEVVLIWLPVRGTVQAIAAGWYAQGVWTLWLAPLALAGCYYIIPKVSGRVLSSYESAPLGFWCLLSVGAWTGGRHLIGGPVPAWIATMAVVTSALMLFHYLVVALNFRGVASAPGTGATFIRFGVSAYLLVGLLEVLTSFRSVALHTQFTFFATAQTQLGYYGAISMMFFGAVYYLVPRLAGRAWSSAGLVAGHRGLVMLGVVGSVAGLALAGFTQGAGLLQATVSQGSIFEGMRLPLLLNTCAQATLLVANLLLVVNLIRTIATCCTTVDATAGLFRPSMNLEAPAS
jgi:cytochrome c oxidase cbb3-type subunit I